MPHIPDKMPPIMPPCAPGLQWTCLDCFGGYGNKKPSNHGQLLGSSGLAWIGLDLVGCCLGAGRGTRTPTVLPPADFESAASTNSAIPAEYVHRAADFGSGRCCAA